MSRDIEAEFKKHLEEQLDFLQSSATAFDGGFKGEAKRMALALRVLLHDTKQSTSLLTHLGKKDIKFYDTAIDCDPSNLLGQFGLTMVKLGNGSADHVAPLDNGPPSRYRKGAIPFEPWWNKVVIDDKQGTKLTRKDLVLSLCNKDGGGHIDPNLSDAYEKLTRSKSFIWTSIVGGVESNFITSPELASVRQITHEVIKSLAVLRPRT